jgi:CelD/BcsL family acetyltransferase involved in cellulose biosynthesis
VPALLPIPSTVGRDQNEFCLRIVLYRSIPDDAALREQWNALVAQADRPEVFYTHQWALAVQRAYGQTLVPWLLLQYEGDVLTGVAALATEARQQKATFLAGTTADYCDFLGREPDRVAFLDLVFAELRKAGVNEVVLPNLPADSVTTKALRSLAGKHSYHVFLRKAYLCAQVELGSEDDRQQLKARLNTRKIFRRGMNFLGRQGKVTLVHRTTPGSIEAVLHEFAVAHVARFLATGRLSNLVSRQRRVFLAELARLLSDSGWLVLSQMLVGDHPVAWNYGFQFHGSWFWYQPTFDTNCEQVSPGYCLLSKMIAEACDTPEMKVVDLGLGAEDYKERFANVTRETLHATLTTSRGRQVREVVRYRASQTAKLSPRVEDVLRTGIQRFDSVRRRFRQSGSRAFVSWGARRLSALLSSQDEVFFYEGSDSPRVRERARATPMRLEPLTLEKLAMAAMQFERDNETCAYLVRAASRLRSSEAKGLVLFDEKSTPAHFCWVVPFEGFYIDELKIRLSAPSMNASLIFDCWTPAPLRGSGYYDVAVTLAATQLARDGRSPWIFSASSNDASIRGLAKTGFERRYSMIRRRTLMVQSVKTVFPTIQPAVEVPAGSQADGRL